MYILLIISLAAAVVLLRASFATLAPSASPAKQFRAAAYGVCGVLATVLFGAVLDQIVIAAMTA